MDQGLTVLVEPCYSEPQPSRFAGSPVRFAWIPVGSELLYTKMIRSYQNHIPNVDARAFVAETSALIGRVFVGSGSSIWYGSVLRGDVDDVRIGERTSVQDGAVLHCDPGSPCLVGNDVTIGHNATVHGCTIGDGAVIGIGATVLSWARVGEGALIAAGALVPEGAEIPPHTVAMGIPARSVRPVNDAERERFAKNCAHYVALAAEYLAGTTSTPAPDDESL